MKARSNSAAACGTGIGKSTWCAGESPAACYARIADLDAVMTDPEHRDEVAPIHAEVVASFPVEEDDPRWVEFKQFRQKTRYDLKAGYAGNPND